MCDLTDFNRKPLASRGALVRYVGDAEAIQEAVGLLEEDALGGRMASVLFQGNSAWSCCLKDLIVISDCPSKNKDRLERLASHRRYIKNMRENIARIEREICKLEQGFLNNEKH